MALQTAVSNHPVSPAELDGYDAARVSDVAAKAYARLTKAWHLNNATAAELISVSPRTWARMKTGNWSGKLNRDQLMRVSALTGLYKALHLYFSDDLADQWPNLRNAGPLFAGRDPIAAMIGGGLPAMLDVRNYVDALRGGA
ncbi:MAG: antitoxin Xre-like helix-turn-helix domain-containing protein [Rhizobiaceae bacterium]